MRVRSWTIDGAAALPSLDSGELPNGLVVVYSPDARRVDAAIAMIRRILFSAPPPDGGEEARTSMLLSGRAGDFELEANGAPDSETFRRAGGQPAGLEDLGRLFGSAARSDLRRVFDLVAGDGADADIDARLLQPAALAGTDSLRRRMEELLGDDDRGEIHDLLAELDAIDERLREAIAWEAAHGQLQIDERSATDAVGQLCADLADLRRRRERLKAYAAAWPVWSAFRQADDQLAALEEIDEFPEDELSIGEALEAAEATEERALALRKEHRQARAELEAMPAAGERHAVVERAEELCAELPAYRQQMTAFARARARYDELAGLSRELGKRVGGDDGETSFDPARLDLDAAREWLTRSDSLADREAMTRASLERTRSAIKQLRNERQRAIRAAKSLTVRLDDCDEHWRALWSLRDDLEQLWEIQSQGEAAARTAEQRLESLDGAKAQRWRRPPHPLFGKLLWTVAGSAFAAALWKSRQEDEQMTLVFAAVVVAAVLLQIVTGWRWRVAQVRNRDLAARQERLRYDLERARQLRDARWRAADEITHRVEDAALALGLSPVPSVEEVDAAEAALFDASRKLHERGPLAETALAFHDYRDEEELLMAQLREIHQARDSAALEWEEWKSSVGLPAALAQEDLTTYLFELDRWSELADEMASADAQLRQLAPAIEAWEAKARELLISVGVESDASVCGRDLEDQLTVLLTSARRSRELLRRRTELGERLVELHRELAAAEQESAAARSSFESLRRAAGTGDRAEFERRRAVFRTRRGLLETRAAHRAELARLLGEHHLADDDATRADLAAGDAETWIAEGRAVDARLEHLEAELEAASHRRTLAAAACREIETSSRAAALRQERACVEEELRRRAAEWRSLALAEALLEDAAHSLSATSTLLDEASSSLRHLTLGELVRIAAPSDGGHLLVVDRGGEQHPVNGNLPPALARLVQLSLRLSLARDFGRGAEPMPVIMDEMLSGLEEPQAAAAAAEIAALAEGQQVFYFTSEGASVEALRSAATASRVLTV